MTQNTVFDVTSWEWSSESVDYQLIWPKGLTHFLLGMRPKENDVWVTTPVTNPAFTIPEDATLKDVRPLAERFMQP